MKSQFSNANVFKRLHQRNKPLVLTNIWDVGGAQALEKNGASSIATSSWAIAAANGYQDGENIPFKEMLGVIQRICESVTLPVSVDIECGYAKNLKELQNNVAHVLQAGAVGINIEDQILGEDKLCPVEEQGKKLTCIKAVAEKMSIPLFINARTDVFFQKNDSECERQLIKRVLDRADVYRASGADGLFVPGLTSPVLMKELCQSSPLPVNVMILDNTVNLDGTGVARISRGPQPYIDYITRLAQLQ